MRYSLAIDIGASGGKAAVGHMSGGNIVTDEVFRFENGMTESDGHLVWDTDRLFRMVKQSVAAALKKYPTLDTLSIDTWGVDYVLMRGDEEVKPVYAYRDSRNEAYIPTVHSIIPHSELYARTGVQFNSFNSVYSLYADKCEGRLLGVTDFLMIPEYLMYRLTGVKKKEFTNATTTSLLSAETGEFDKYIFERLGLPETLISHIYPPATAVGMLLPELQAELGGNPLVLLCPTHDTGAAVEGIPMEIDTPYISSGTWSLLGIKTPKPLCSESCRLSGFSNEGGVGYNRFQKNVGGMWFIQSLRRELCPDKSYAEIEKMAAEADFCELFDINHPRFFSPQSMKAEIIADLSERGLTVPTTDAELFSAAYHSIAAGYAVAIRDLEAAVGRTYDTVFIVGGGARDSHLNRLTEQTTAKRVVALPIEASMLGNLKAQLNS